MTVEPTKSQLEPSSFIGTWLPRIAYLVLAGVSILTLWSIFVSGSEKSSALDVDSSVLTQANEIVTLSDYLGKPLVVNFYASTCGPCRAELPDFDEVYRAVHNEVAFVGVNHDTTEGVWRSFDEEIPVSYDTVFQPEQSIFAAASGIGMPTTLFVDSDGKIVKTFTGALTKDNLRLLIETHLGAL